MSADYRRRFEEIIPESIRSHRIIVIGAGAIGGWAITNLAKTGFTNLTVYDDDVVSPENIGVQPYGIADLALKKVEAMWSKCTQVGVSLRVNDVKFARDTMGSTSQPEIFLCCVDSMEARKAIWTILKDRKDAILIDLRMGAESALGYVMRCNKQKDILAYEKTLYSDAQAVQERCTAKATVYTACYMGALATQLVKEVLTRPDYVRLVSWDIKEFALQIYRKEVA